MTWSRCPTFGDFINDLFVPFKTPIDGNFDTNISEENKFTLGIFSALKRTKDIGMLIDLSGPEVHYEPEQLSGTKSSK